MSGFFHKEVSSLLPRILKEDSLVLITLEGELGAGKTTFVKELLQALNYPPDQVQSPSFLKLLEYELPQFGCVVHMDCYRMDSADELLELGMDYYFEKARLICIEWPQLFLDAQNLPPEFDLISLNFVLNENGERSLQMTGA